MPNIETIVAWLCPWVVGLFFSLYVGHLVTECFLDYLHEWMGYSKTKSFPPSPKSSRRSVPRELTGFIERLLFTILVGAGVEGVLTAMMAWLALKMASNWNFPGKKSPRPLAMSALLAGGISMLFAFFGGMIRRLLACLS